MSDILDLQKDIRSILQNDSSLNGIKFYMGYNKSIAAAPITGVHACILINKYELTEPAAGSIIDTDNGGYIGSFEVEIKVYANMATGSLLCSSSMGKIAQSLIYCCSKLNANMDKLYIIPIKCENSISAVVGSVVLAFSAYTVKEA